MKKIIVVVLAALMVLAAMGCAKPADAKKVSALEKIQKAGKLVIATSPDYAPMEFVDSSKTGQDQYVGYEMTLARYIAEKLGVKLEIQAMDFKTVLVAVSQGTVDMAISGLAVKPDRKETMDFTNPDYVEPQDKGHVIVVLKSDLDKYKTFADFKGKLVGAQNASLQEQLLKEQAPDAKLEPIGKINEGIMSLTTKKIVGLAMSGSNAELYIKQNPNLAIAVHFVYTPEVNGACIALPKGDNATLIAKLNEIIKEVSDSGKAELWHNEAVELASTMSDK